MINYFKKLFEYDVYANRLILLAMQEIHNRGNAVNLMAHTLSAQQVWLSRCKKEATDVKAIWPEWPLQSLPEIAIQNGAHWISFIKTLSADNFSEVIKYKNSRGEEYNNQLQDIIAHVINHGTHHRAQIGQLLKLAGYGTLPVTDYILYVRENEK